MTVQSCPEIYFIFLNTILDHSAMPIVVQAKDIVKPIG